MSGEHTCARREYGRGELQDCGGMAVHWWADTPASIPTVRYRAIDSKPEKA
jgi:hypothetical protein